MNPRISPLQNPFKPGAGHMPPYLAGREAEGNEFRRLLQQETILENLVLTGLRGVGKTVLLETWKQMAIQEGWLWVGTDLSESAGINEESIAIRLLTDLSVVSSSIVIGAEDRTLIGFAQELKTVSRTLNFAALKHVYNQTPGLVVDKLKHVLEVVWSYLSPQNRRGLIFAYDEAQTLADCAAKEQYPLSLLLDVFQSIQRKNIPFMLALTGLPTLFPKLVEARTYSERMFRVVFLDRLSPSESRDAILKPIEDAKSFTKFTSESVDTTIVLSGGYPYFIQFICREVFDVFLQKLGVGMTPFVPEEEIVRKLDSDFFAGRWARVTDRQRELLGVISRLKSCEDEFTVQEIVQLSHKLLKRPFGSSHVNQMLATLGESGLVYKNRYGKYSFAVPLLNRFILRQLEGETSL